MTFMSCSWNFIVEVIHATLFWEIMCLFWRICKFFFPFVMEVYEYQCNHLLIHCKLFTELRYFIILEIWRCPIKSFLYLFLFIFWGFIFFITLVLGWLDIPYETIRISIWRRKQNIMVNRWISKNLMNCRSYDTQV